MKTTLDGLLGRVTMYRLVLLCLVCLAAAAVVLSAGGQLGFRVPALLASAAVLLVVSYLANRLFALLFGVTPHSESTVITALLLFFILQPSTDPLVLGQVGLAALFAAGSKYVLAVRGRHIFNPAAVGAVWLAVLHFYLALWWVASGALVAISAVLALLVLYRTRRLPLAAVFVVVAGGILMTRHLSGGADLGASLKFAFAQTPLVFFCGFMLSEPLTLPPQRWQQLGVAGLVGVLFGVPITIGSYLFGPESALIIGNAVAFAFGQRRGVELVLTAQRKLSALNTELVFRPRRPLAFAAGQYLELAVPHRHADLRGIRRTFSIVSAPEERDQVRIALKVPADRPSSFKQTLTALQPGAVVRATGVGGDFLLPHDRSVPVLLIAGGIGITPFVSQLSSAAATADRDVVVVYLAADPADLAYVPELTAGSARVVLVTRSPAADIGSAENLVLPRMGEGELRAAVPDLARRRVLVSGPPGLVDELSSAARRAGARRVRKDYFSGY